MLFTLLCSLICLREFLCYEKLNMCKSKASSHCLTIETGRYKYFPLQRRLCHLCSADIPVVLSKIEKVPGGIRGEKSSKDMASSRN